MFLKTFSLGIPGGSVRYFFLTQLGYEQVWAEAIGDLICQERKGEKLKKMMINPEDRKLNSYTVPVF